MSVNFTELNKAYDSAQQVIKMSRMYVPASEASSSIDWSAGLDISCHGIRIPPRGIQPRFGLSHLRNKRKQKQQ